jgi:hypothetical protein
MIKLLPVGRADFLGVVKPGAAEFSRQNHRGRCHWARQRPPTRLVNSRDPSMAAGLKGEFEG